MYDNMKKQGVYWGQGMKHHSEYEGYGIDCLLGRSFSAKQHVWALLSLVRLYNKVRRLEPKRESLYNL